MKSIPARLRPAALALGAGVLLGACTVMPTEPGVLAMPGSRKSVEHYQADVMECRQYADSVIAAHGSGTDYPSMSSYQLQRGYDRAYLQCMYSRGNRVPVRAAAPGPARPSYLPPGPSAAAYPPPPNTPPPAGLPGSPAQRSPAPGGTVYPLPIDLPPSSYPPPNTPPPSGLPPRN